MACGLDVDIKDGHDGERTLLDISNGEGLDTLRVLTPTGGYHLYYKTNKPLPIKNSIGIADGLDIRADGGYLVGAGSDIHDKHYTFKDPAADILPAPQWLLDLLPGKSKPKKQPELPTALSDKTILEGSRNEMLFRRARGSWDMGATKEHVMGLILDINQSQRKPPLENNEIEKQLVPVHIPLLSILKRN